MMFFLNRNSVFIKSLTKILIILWALAPIGGILIDEIHHQLEENVYLIDILPSPLSPDHHDHHDLHDRYYDSAIFDQFTIPFSPFHLEPLSLLLSFVVCLTLFGLTKSSLFFGRPPPRIPHDTSLFSQKIQFRI